MYGVWDKETKRFTLGISEATPELAMAKWKKATSARKKLCEVREIPKGWKNPPHQKYKQLKKRESVKRPKEPKPHKGHVNKYADRKEEPQCPKQN